ncbi:hypothetical protein [Burkholderia ambifaria]|uniref:hypothetical protein n=1 Tax=Burkholderia ambifaria TaxID=152480 RepID=UPI00158870C3|nr:hypothetical protein [Burkholderia ambifaria]
MRKRACQRGSKIRAPSADFAAEPTSRVARCLHDATAHTRADAIPAQPRQQHTNPLGVYTYADTDIASIQDFIGRLSDLFLD